MAYYMQPGGFDPLSSANPFSSVSRGFDSGQGSAMGGQGFQGRRTLPQQQPPQPLSQSPQPINTQPFPLGPRETTEPNVLGAQAVRPGASQQSRGFDSSYLQNLATAIGNLFSRPQGNLQFNPLGDLSDITSQQTGGGNAPVPGLPGTMLQDAITGQGFGYQQPQQQAPPMTPPEFQMPDMNDIINGGYNRRYDDYNNGQERY